MEDELDVSGFEVAAVLRIRRFRWLWEAVRPGKFDILVEFQFAFGRIRVGYLFLEEIDSGWKVKVSAEVTEGLDRAFILLVKGHRTPPNKVTITI